MTASAVFMGGFKRGHLPFGFHALSDVWGGRSAKQGRSLPLRRNGLSGLSSGQVEQVAQRAATARIA